MFAAILAVWFQAVPPDTAAIRKAATTYLKADTASSRSVTIKADTAWVLVMPARNVSGTYVRIERRGLRWVAIREDGMMIR